MARFREKIPGHLIRLHGRFEAESGRDSRQRPFLTAALLFKAKPLSASHSVKKESEIALLELSLLGNDR